MAAVDKRLKRIRAQVGADGQGIRPEGTLPLISKIGFGIGRGGGSDIVALRIHDHEKALAGCILANASQCHNTAWPQFLEEGTLRLNDRDQRMNHIDNLDAELLKRVCDRF